MSIEAMKQALEALESHGAHAGTCDYCVLLPVDPPKRKPCSCGLAKSIESLRQAIEQAEKEQADFQDFVAKVQEVEKQACEIINRQWVGLTDEDMASAWAQSKGDVLSRLWPFARAIEAKLREKNAYGWQSVENPTEYLDELRGGDAT